MVMACAVIHNYILGVDPYDTLVNSVGSSSEILYDTQNLSSEHSIQPLSQSQQRAANQDWVAKREAMAAAMWENYQQVMLPH
jgi:hypothetical protein